MLTFEVIEDQIAGSINGKPFSIEFDAKTYKALQKLEADLEEMTDVKAFTEMLEKARVIVTKDLAMVIETECEYIRVDRKTGSFHLFYNKRLSSIPMPKELVDRILASQDKGIDFMPLIKMWVRFLRNPNLNNPGKGKAFARKFFNFVNMKYVHPELVEEFRDKGFSDVEATKRATMYQMKITKEGLLNGYKVSREVLVKYKENEEGEIVQTDRYARSFDVNTGQITGTEFPEHVEDRLFEPAMMGQSGDAFSCVGKNGFPDAQHFIKVGCTHSLSSWDQVNTDDNTSCVKGLHFGGLYYINSIGGEIHNIFVDPMNVGAVPDDNTGAVRCKEYFVHSSLVGVNGSIYHSSAYAKATDTQWEEMLNEATKVKLERDAEATEELHSLEDLS